jgi:hypothetical protein
MRIKQIIPLVGGAAMALAVGGIAKAGEVGIQRTYVYESNPQYLSETYPQFLTVPQIVDALEQASEKDMQDARDGNKNNPEFVERGAEADELATQLAYGHPITVAQVDDALSPVHVW